jgi:hypothetical protein
MRSYRTHSACGASALRQLIYFTVYSRVLQKRGFACYRTFGAPKKSSAIVVEGIPISPGE